MGGQLKAQTTASANVVMVSEECTKSGEPPSFKADEEQTLPEAVNGDSYLHVDNEIQCEDEDSDPDDETV